MKKAGLSFTLLLAGAFGLSAQIALHGKIANIPPSALQVALVDYWAVDHWQQVAILQLETGGTFSSSIAPPVEAQCRIRMAGQSRMWSDFMASAPGPNRDSILNIGLDYTAMDGGPARVSGSAENDLYFTLMSAQHKLEQLRDTSKVATPAQVQEAERNLNRLCADMIKQHPGTYTGDIVANLLYQPVKEDYPKDPKVIGMTANAFVTAHALDKIPFRYDRILYHTAFSKALDRYHNYFDAASADGSKNYIDGIMAKRNGNEAVDVFVFKHLLNKMLDDKDEAGMNHLLTWYLPDCSDESPLPDYTRTFILALKNCTPGNVVPDIQMPGPDGNPVSLGDVCAKNKMTLLFFWRSNCSHCKEFKPVLKELYDKYHAQGLEVYAMSLDKTDAGWKETLQHEPTKWVNVFVPAERREETNKIFPIPSTPTLISLDRNRKVLSRLILREQLDAYLKDTLPKLNGG